MNKQLLEFLHTTERIPDRYYNQLNGKTIQENFVIFKEKQTSELDDYLSLLDLLENIK